MKPFKPVAVPVGWFFNLSQSRMKFLTRSILLATLTEFKTLKAEELLKKEKLGFIPDANQLKFLLHQLTINGYICVLKHHAPITYSITKEGIAESARRSKLKTEMFRSCYLKRSNNEKPVITGD